MNPHPAVSSLPLDKIICHAQGAILLSASFKKQHNTAQTSSDLPTVDIPVARPLTMDEVAEYLSIHTRTVRRWIESGELRAYRYGPRNIRVDAVDLEKFREQIAPSTYEHVTGGDR